MQEILTILLINTVFKSVLQKKAMALIDYSLEDPASVPGTGRIPSKRCTRWVI